MTQAIKYVEAVNWKRNVAPRQFVKWVVLHSMETPDSDLRAETCAARFADPVNAPEASCHYCIDSNSIVQCVKERNIAWHAPGANTYGIGIELCGYAKQSRDQWLDDFGRSMLSLSAALTAGICGRWNIPMIYVDADGLKNGLDGITTHDAVSKAFRKSDHWDPGPGFPMDWYIEKVNEFFSIGKE